MKPNEPRTYRATLGDLNLQTWESPDGFRWSVTHSQRGEAVAAGEAVDLPSAMVAAAQAAQAEWGAVRWSSSEGETEASTGS